MFAANKKRIDSDVWAMHNDVFANKSRRLCGQNVKKLPIFEIW